MQISNRYQNLEMNRILRKKEEDDEEKNQKQETVSGETSSSAAKSSCSAAPVTASIADVLAVYARADVSASGSTFELSKAQELLEAGDLDKVIEYFDSCKQAYQYDKNDETGKIVFSFKYNNHTYTNVIFEQTDETTNTTETPAADETSGETTEEDKKFADIKGSEYAVNINADDYEASSLLSSSIMGTVSADKTCAWYDNWDTYDKMAKMDAQDKAEKFLTEENSLKSDIQEQIENMLAAKGIPFSKIEALFENVYAQSIDTAVEGISWNITHDVGQDGTTRYAFADIEQSVLIDSFVSAFNTNIAAAIDEMNASDKDFDLQDIDYSVFDSIDINSINKETADFLNNVRNTMLDKNSTDSISQKKKYSDEEAYYSKLKPQLLEKAKKMCNANGIEFNEEEFETIFDNTVAEVCTSILDRLKSSIASSSDARTACANFLNNFKANYTDWVKKQ